MSSFKCPSSLPASGIIKVFSPCRVNQQQPLLRLQFFHYRSRNICAGTCKACHKVRNAVKANNTKTRAKFLETLLTNMNLQKLHTSSLANAGLMQNYSLPTHKCKILFPSPPELSTLFGHCSQYQTLAHLTLLLHTYHKKLYGLRDILKHRQVCKYVVNERISK